MFWVKSSSKVMYFLRQVCGHHIFAHKFQIELSHVHWVWSPYLGVVTICSRSLGVVTIFLPINFGIFDNLAVKPAVIYFIIIFLKSN